MLRIITAIKKLYTKKQPANDSEPTLQNYTLDNLLQDLKGYITYESDFIGKKPNEFESGLVTRIFDSEASLPSRPTAQDFRANIQHAVERHLLLKCQPGVFHTSLDLDLATWPIHKIQLLQEFFSCFREQKTALILPLEKIQGLLLEKIIVFRSTFTGLVQSLTIASETTLTKKEIQSLTEPPSIFDQLPVKTTLFFATYFNNPYEKHSLLHNITNRGYPYATMIICESPAEKSATLLDTTASVVNQLNAVVSPKTPPRKLQPDDTAEPLDVLACEKKSSPVTIAANAEVFQNEAAPLTRSPQLR